MKLLWFCSLVILHWYRVFTKYYHVKSEEHLLFTTQVFNNSKLWGKAYTVQFHTRCTPILAQLSIIWSNYLPLLYSEVIKILQLLALLFLGGMHPQEVEINACPSVWITGTVWLLLQDMQEIRPIPKHWTCSVWCENNEQFAVSISGADLHQSSQCQNCTCNLGSPNLLKSHSRRKNRVSKLYSYLFCTLWERDVHFPGPCCKGAVFVAHGMW